MAQILRCCGCGVGQQLQLQFHPRLGTSIYQGCSPKKQKKKKKEKKGKEKKKYDIQLTALVECDPC